MCENDFRKLEETIGYRFKNKELLKNAFTHKTYAFEAKTPVEYNEPGIINMDEEPDEDDIEERGPISDKIYVRRFR